MNVEIDLEARRIYVTAPFDTNANHMRLVAVAKLRNVPAPVHTVTGQPQEWSRHLGSATREVCATGKKLSWKLQSFNRKLHL